MSIFSKLFSKKQAEGEENTKRIFKLAQAGKTPKEIAEICEVSVEKVQHILE